MLINFETTCLMSHVHSLYHFDSNPSAPASKFFPIGWQNPKNQYFPQKWRKVTQIGVFRTCLILGLGSREGGQKECKI